MYVVDKIRKHQQAIGYKNQLKIVKIFRDEESRKCNLIMYGVPGSKDNDGKKKKEDMRKTGTL